MKLMVIERLSVQNMNAMSGQVYGAVGIVPSLGFVHALQRKLNQLSYDGELIYGDLVLQGCIVAVHSQQIHTYRNEHKSIKFLQSRNPPALYGVADGKKSENAPIIEEGRMNAEISLIIPYEANLQTHQYDDLKNEVEKWCQRLRFAGGMILKFNPIQFYTINDNDDSENNIPNIQLRKMIRRLLPSFVLYGCQNILSNHVLEKQKDNPEFDVLQGLMDFMSYKSVARPKHDLIDKYLQNNQIELWQKWQSHLENLYSPNDVPEHIQNHFDELKSLNKKKDKNITNLLKQWENYCNPTDKTEAYWQSVPKPQKGYFVPMMCGYKAISPVYSASQVANTRDGQTDVCFVEAVHTLAKWQGIHHIKNLDDLKNAVWYYDYQPNWYLCRQGQFDEHLSQSLSINNTDNQDDDDLPI